MLSTRGLVWFTSSLLTLPVAPFKAGSPSPDPWPGRNQAAQQEVSSRQASHASSMYLPWLPMAGLTTALRFLSAQQQH